MKKASKTDRAYRLVMLALLGVAAFAGVMSVISGDVVIRYVVSGVVVFFCVKELY